MNLQPIIDSFHFFRNNLEKIATLLIIFAVVSRGIEFAVAELAPESAEELDLVGYRLLFSALLNVVFQSTFIIMLAKMTKNQQVVISQCFRQALPIMPLYLLASAAFQFIVFVGVIILLVFPGVYAYARLNFFDFALVLKRENPIDAMKTSWEIRTGSVVKILLTLLPVAVIMLATVASFGLIGERNFALDTLVSFVFWVFGGFLVVVRYRLYTILSAEKKL